MSRFRGATDPALAAIRLAPADEAREQRRMRIAVAGSVVLHLALLSLALPRAPLPLPEPPAEPRIFRLPDFRPKPPQPAPPPTPAAPRAAARTVPVPTALVDPPAPVAPPRVELPAELPLDLPVWAPPPPPPVPAAPIRFGHGMTRPVRIAGPDPAYTEPARRARVTGVVILEAVLDRDGRVTEIEVLKSLPLGLTRSAVDAVSRWRFEPATLDGQPVAVIYNLTVRFELD